jgi:DNA-binding CsgD family transcriptional regulator
MLTCSLVYQSSGALKLGRGVSLDRQNTPENVAALEDLSGSVLQALDVLNDGLILTDATSRVLYLNRAARAILSSGSLAVRNGLLCAQTASETRNLQDIIAARARRSAADAYLRTTGPCVRHCVLLTVTAAHVSATDRLSDEATVLVLARELSRVNAPSPKMIGIFFGLTPAEARLAHEMIRGDGLGPCASRLGITTNTARTHLNRVFEKTGTKRQAELVRLLLSCGFSINERRPAPAELVNESRIRDFDQN